MQQRDFFDSPGWELRSYRHQCLRRVGCGTAGSVVFEAKGCRMDSSGQLLRFARCDPGLDYRIANSPRDLLSVLLLPNEIELCCSYFPVVSEFADVVELGSVNDGSGDFVL